MKSKSGNLPPKPIKPKPSFSLSIVSYLPSPYYLSELIQLAIFKASSFDTWGIGGIGVA